MRILRTVKHSRTEVVADGITEEELGRTMVKSLNENHSSTYHDDFYSLDTSDSDIEFMDVGQNQTQDIERFTDQVVNALFGGKK